MQDNVYNIYCDESRIENQESNNMIIGALIIPRKSKQRILKKIKEIYLKHNFRHELKWTKAHKAYFDFYKEIIDFFIDEDSLNYRCVVVDKTKMNLDQYHDGDLELAFYKFYYLMLKSKLLSQNKYYIFLDKKPTRDKNRARALHAYLDAYILQNKQNCGIEHFQAYSSNDNMFIQLADFFTGLVGFEANEDKNNSPKKQIVNYFKLKLKRDNLLITSFLNENKFNIFVWNSDICKK